MSEDVGETAKQLSKRQITTRSGQSYGVSGFGVNESSIDSHVGLSDSAANTGSTVAEEDASFTPSRESDSAGQDVGSPTSAELPVGGAGSYTGDQRRHVLSPEAAHQTPTQLVMGRYHDIPLDGDDDDDSCSTVQLKSPVMQCASTPSPWQSWVPVPQSQPPPSDSNWLQSIKHMMNGMTNDMTCNTRDMLGNIHDIAETTFGRYCRNTRYVRRYSEYITGSDRCCN